LILQYELENLKIICEEWLCSHLTYEKAADFLVLADVYFALHLKVNTIEFIRKYVFSLSIKVYKHFYFVEILFRFWSLVDGKACLKTNQISLRRCSSKV